MARSSGSRGKRGKGGSAKASDEPAGGGASREADGADLERAEAAIEATLARIDLANADFDRLSDEEVEAIKTLRRGVPPAGGVIRGGAELEMASESESEASGLVRRLNISPDLEAGGNRVVVAEGDSWFDLPWAYVVTDLLDCLTARHGYLIDSYSRRGDTVENMVYGTMLDRRGERLPPTLDEVIERVRVVKPRVFLFSGGGNDIAGDEFTQFLNHAGSGQSSFRAEHAAYVIDTVLRGAYERLIERVRAASPGTVVVTHGYARALPSGKGARIIVTFAGPWLRPALSARAIIPDTEGRGIVAWMIDRFNAMLASVAEESGGAMAYVDVRGVVKDSDWVDELHLGSGGYARCADAVQAKISEVVAGW